GQAAGGPGLALTALLALFLPGFLLALGVEPLWARLNRRARLRQGLGFAAAAATGLLAAAFFGVIVPEALSGPGPVAVAGGALVLLWIFRAPPPLVVLLAALAGAALGGA